MSCCVDILLFTCDCSALDLLIFLHIVVDFFRCYVTKDKWNHMDGAVLQSQCISSISIIFL